MRLYMSLARPAWFSCTEMKNHSMACILLLSVWMFHYYPLPSTSPAFISFTLSWLLFEILPLTPNCHMKLQCPWQGSSSWWTLKKQRQKLEQRTSALRFLKSLYLTLSKLMKFLGCLMIQHLACPARKHALNFLRKCTGAGMRLPHQGCMCMKTSKRCLAAIMPVGSF